MATLHRTRDPLGVVAAVCSYHKIVLLGEQLHSVAEKERGALLGTERVKHTGMEDT